MRLILTLVLVVLAAGLQAQQDITAQISDALGKGDARTIGKYLVSSVDLTIIDDEDMYPKDQVVRKLEQFFQKNTPQRFEIKHQGTSKLDDHYRIGDLSTSGGMYRVTFFMKNGGSAMEIKQLRIERYE